MADSKDTIGDPSFPMTLRISEWRVIMHALKDGGATSSQIRRSINAEMDRLAYLGDLDTDHDI